MYRVVRHYSIAVTSVVNPARKKTNIAAIMAFVRFDDPLNSFQTKTPQIAATIVPP
jgi:hypothetical protein